MFLSRRFAEGGRCDESCVPALRATDGTPLRLHGVVIEQRAGDSFTVVGIGLSVMTDTVRRGPLLWDAVRMRCTRGLVGALCEEQSRVLVHEETLWPQCVLPCGDGFLVHVFGDEPESTGVVLLDRELASLEFAPRLTHTLESVELGGRYCGTAATTNAASDLSVAAYRREREGIVTTVYSLPDREAWVETHPVHTLDGVGMVYANGPRTTFYFLPDPEL